MQILILFNQKNIYFFSIFTPKLANFSQFFRWLGKKWIFLAEYSPMELLKPIFAFKYWENLVSSSTFPSYTAQILQELHTKLCNKKTISRSFKIKSMRLRFLQKNFWIPIWIKQIFLLLVSLYAPKCIITTIYRQHKYNIKMIV